MVGEFTHFILKLHWDFPGKPGKITFPEGNSITFEVLSSDAVTSLFPVSFQHAVLISSRGTF